MSQVKDGIATRDTQLIRNAWYVAATSGEITQDLSDRWLLGVNVLMYRTVDGQPVALDNRCPHRSFPLSRGKREGDNVVCGYHGLTLNPIGQCVHYPPSPKTQGAVRTSAFPVIERTPLIWIWMGTPELADPLLIPEYHDFTDPTWTSVSGYYHIAANYVGLHENLQDLSHFEHLHASSIGSPDQATAEIAHHSDNGRIHSTTIYRNIPTPPLWKEALDITSERITRTITEAFHSPALCDATTTIRGVRAGEDQTNDSVVKILHFITPEHQHKTHYWWFFLRSFALDDANTDELFRQGIGNAFLEDKDALEAISALAQVDQRQNFREVSFSSDKGGVITRRLLHKLAMAETVNAV